MRHSFCRVFFGIILLSDISAHAMPIGLRTAMWNISGANNRTAVARLLPEDCEESEIPVILEAFSDCLLGGYITNKLEYTSFRNWALGSGEKAENLSSSQMAWISFALNAAGLMAAVNDGDLNIDSIVASDVAGRFDIVFSLANAKVGLSAIEARLKTVFGVEGSTTLDKNSFSSDGVDILLSPTDDGRIKATVIPPSSETGTYFMRVKVKENMGISPNSQ